ncbi:hypothetical protein NQD34_000087 [Periophthalmus magnuspinnatus]|nr:hypothetical protein NQD34_000087 [Periophthalmus magnuspinnatus]
MNKGIKIYLHIGAVSIGVKCPHHRHILIYKPYNRRPCPRRSLEHYPLLWCNNKTVPAWNLSESVWIRCDSTVILFLILFNIKVEDAHTVSSSSTRPRSSIAVLLCTWITSAGLHEAGRAIPN